MQMVQMKLWLITLEQKQLYCIVLLSQREYISLITLLPILEAA